MLLRTQALLRWHGKKAIFFLDSASTAEIESNVAWRLLPRTEWHKQVGTCLLGNTILFYIDRNVRDTIMICIFTSKSDLQSFCGFCLLRSIVYRPSVVLLCNLLNTAFRKLNVSYINFVLKLSMTLKKSFPVQKTWSLSKIVNPKFAIFIDMKNGVSSWKRSTAALLEMAWLLWLPPARIGKKLESFLKHWKNLELETSF